MPFTQIDDVLRYDGEVVKATGTLVRPQDLDLNPELHPNLNPELEIPPELVKTFWVRVCRGEHTGSGMRAHIAEGSAFDEGFLNADGTWALDCRIRAGDEMQPDEATVTATLVYETDDDLLTLAWAECVHLHPCQES